MALELPYGLKRLTSGPDSEWYGPYASVAAANTAVPVAVRTKRTVLVGIVEYWWRDGTADGNLVVKTAVGEDDNPFDIVEVPGNIATFTVLLAHKNCVLNFRSDTDFTVLLSSVIGVEDFFCYIKMKGAGKPTLLADTGYTLEATSPTIFTTEGEATVYYAGSNVFSASGALGQVSLEILEPVSSTGVVVKFDLPRTYGYNTPETGDIIFDNTGLGGGITQLMIHNDGSEPAYPTEFKKVVGEYVNNVDNYIWLTVIKPDKIHFVITQEP